MSVDAQDPATAPSSHTSYPLAFATPVHDTEKPVLPTSDSATPAGAASTAKSGSTICSTRMSSSATLLFPAEDASNLSLKPAGAVKENDWGDPPAPASSAATVDPVVGDATTGSVTVTGETPWICKAVPSESRTEKTSADAALAWSAIAEKVTLTDADETLFDSGIPDD